MTHGRAVAAMVGATLLWSIAGVVTRHLDGAGNAFETAFWRSFFCVAALALLLGRLRGFAPLARSLRDGGRTLWLSGACWTVMFTAFMVALTMTSVANVLVTMAIAPLFTAVIARFALGHRQPARTWGAIVAAGAGIAWMYAHEFRSGDARHVTGTLVALGVPIAAAINWTVIQRSGSSRGGPAPPAGARVEAPAGVDLLPAVLIGAVCSSLVTLPAALPLAASLHDVALLALLGVFQLAVPCLVAVAAARYLAAPEAALLSLLEIVFGVAWTWLGSSEAPTRHVVLGGLLVIGALAANEALAWRRAAPAYQAAPNS